MTTHVYINRSRCNCMCCIRFGWPRSIYGNLLCLGCGLIIFKAFSCSSVCERVLYVVAYKFQYQINLRPYEIVRLFGVDVCAGFFTHIQPLNDCTFVMKDTKSKKKKKKKTKNNTTTIHTFISKQQRHQDF